MAVVGGTLIELPAAWIVSHSAWLPTIFTADFVLTGGIVLATIGGLAVLASYSVEAVQKISGILSRTLASIRVGTETFDLRVLKLEDLSEIYVEYRRIFGSDLIPQTQVAEWMKKNPMIAFEVLRSSTKDLGKKRDRAGFFELLPLTQAGEAKLRREAPHTADLGPRDIHSAVRWNMAKAYYIASVGVVEPPGPVREKRRDLARKRSEGAVMKLLQERLGFLSSRRTIEVYARPVTDDGLRLVKNYGFRKRQTHLSDSQAIWSGEVHLGSAVAQQAP